MLGVRVGAVPVLVGLQVAQAIVGAQIDHPHPALEQLVNHGSGGRVRVGDDRRVDVGLHIEVELLEMSGTR